MFESVVVDVKNGCRKSIKRSLQESGNENAKGVHIDLLTVVAKQRRMLPNDVIFRKTKLFK